MPHDQRPECSVTFKNIEQGLKRIEKAQGEGFTGVHGRLDTLNGGYAKHSRRIHTLELEGGHQVKDFNRLRKSLNKLTWVIIGAVLVTLVRYVPDLITHIATTGGP